LMLANKNLGQIMGSLARNNKARYFFKTNFITGN